jgi:multisubunit Na+/H+ antiporter MnhB subunit
VNRAVAGAGAGLLAVALVAAVGDLPAEPGGLTAEAMAALPGTGVTHPPTAVLLDFRAYDTWLEVVVMLLAAVGALAVRRTADLGDVVPPEAAPPVQRAFSHLMAPMLGVLGIYLLSRGTHAPGGAFQAAAVLAAGLLVLWLAGRGAWARAPAAVIRPLLAAGAVAFALSAVANAVLRGAVLDLPPAHARTIIVAVEAAVTVSIAWSLALVFVTVATTGEAAPGGGRR